MKERLYVNPWRHNKDGSPKMQKAPPRLKSAFADRRKKRVHSRTEFGSETVLRRNAWCVLAVGSGRGNPWPYAVHGKGLFHRYLDKCQAIRLRHVIEPVCGYSMEVHETFADADRRTVESEAHIFLSSAEALGLSLAIEHSMSAVAFGVLSI